MNSENGIYSVNFDSPTAIDRIVLLEDQTNGQVIREYYVYAKVVDATGAMSTLVVPFAIVSNGTSVGHTICLMKPYCNKTRGKGDCILRIFPSGGA